MKQTEVNSIWREEKHRGSASQLTANQNHLTSDWPVFTNKRDELIYWTEGRGDFAVTKNIFMKNDESLEETDQLNHRELPDSCIRSRSDVCSERRYYSERDVTAHWSLVLQPQAAAIIKHTHPD